VASLVHAAIGVRKLLQNHKQHVKGWSMECRVQINVLVYLRFGYM
jgi:hypothetical protein